MGRGIGEGTPAAFEGPPDEVWEELRYGGTMGPGEGEAPDRKRKRECEVVEARPASREREEGRDPSLGRRLREERKREKKVEGTSEQEEARRGTVRRPADFSSIGIYLRSTGSASQERSMGFAGIGFIPSGRSNKRSRFKF